MTLLGEQWKPIKGYEGEYSVSSYGRVRSEYKRVPKGNGTTRAVRSRILKPTKAGAGYLTVQLSQGNKATRFYIHRLVAEAYLQNHDHLPMVNHKDGNKKNNRSDNLEWSTHASNTEHAVENDLVCHGERIPNSKLTSEEAASIFIASGKQVDIAKQFNISKMVVSLIKRRKIWRRATAHLV